MTVSLIAAMAEGRVIGSRGGGVPWDAPRDREHFRAYTRGKWMLLGRRTYEEMEGWFTHATPVIATRQPAYRPRRPWHRAVPTAAAGVDLARGNGAAELVVSGGGALYEAALPFVERIVLTRILASFPVPDPVLLPEFESGGGWSLVHREDWPEDGDGTPYPMRLEVWERRQLG